MHWINKSFFAQPKKLPMDYCIWYLPPPPTRRVEDLTFLLTLLEDYWKLHSPGLMTSIKYWSTLKNLVKNESLTPNAKNSIFFYSIPRHIINAKNSIFFYSISRHIVNFYNLPVTLNDRIKCNNQILLTALFFFRSWAYRPLFSMNHNSPLTLKSLLVSLLLGRPFLLLMF